MSRHNIDWVLGLVNKYGADMTQYGHNYFLQTHLLHNDEQCICRWEGAQFSAGASWKDIMSIPDYILRETK